MFLLFKINKANRIINLLRLEFLFKKTFYAISFEFNAIKKRITFTCKSVVKTSLKYANKVCK